MSDLAVVPQLLQWWIFLSNDGQTTKYISDDRSSLRFPAAGVARIHAQPGSPVIRRCCLTGALLWEITRRVLIWYYAAISMVNVIYGSIAITVVALLSIEVVVVILLLGTQVIAELERKPNESDGEAESGFET